MIRYCFHHAWNGSTSAQIACMSRFLHHHHHHVVQHVDPIVRCLLTACGAALR